MYINKKWDEISSITKRKEIIPINKKEIDVFLGSNIKTDLINCTAKIISSNNSISQIVLKEIISITPKANSLEVCTKDYTLFKYNFANNYEALIGLNNLETIINGGNI